MDKVYVSENYIIIEKDGFETPFPNSSIYCESLDSFIIDGGDKEFTIGFSEVGDFFNEAGDTAYTEETLRSFFRLNTGF